MDMPDDYLADIGPVLKKVAQATGAEQFNVLQNNGKMAFQVRSRDLDGRNISDTQRSTSTTSTSTSFRSQTRRKVSFSRKMSGPASRFRERSSRRL